MANAGAAPTGCYKCGRPGHWSRDCPSSAPNPNPNPNPNPTPTPTPNPNPSPSPNPSLTPHPNSNTTFKTTFGGGFSASKPAQKPSEKLKKVPKTRPKLTPELLLSDNGLGYVLRHFPRAFKFRGRGHEVGDLGHLISLYSEWHSHLIPYYSFDQFVHKVEQVGATKRVKMCIRDLREKVSSGGDPTKFHEQPVEHDGLNPETEAMDVEEPSHSQGEPSSKTYAAEDIQNEMFHEIYKNATEEPSQAFCSEVVSVDIPPVDSSIKELPDRGLDDNPGSSGENQINDEQRARIEANRLKALEKAAAARARLLPAA